MKVVVVRVVVLVLLLLTKVTGVVVATSRVRLVVLALKMRLCKPAETAAKKKKNPLLPSQVALSFLVLALPWVC